MVGENECWIKPLWKGSTWKNEWRWSRWSSGAAGQAVVQQWPQIDSSVSVHPARSCTQHPHCLLCQGVKAALASSGGYLRQAKIHVSLFLIFCILHFHIAYPASSFSFLSCWRQLIYVCYTLYKSKMVLFHLLFSLSIQIINYTNGDSKNLVN